MLQKSVDNFEVAHKTCLFLVRGAVPPEGKVALTITECIEKENNLKLK